MSSSSWGCHASPEPQHLAQCRQPHARPRGRARTTAAARSACRRTRSPRGWRRTPASRRISSRVTEPSAMTWQPDRSAKAAARKCAPHMRPAPQPLTKTSSRSSGRHCSYTPGHVEAGRGVADLRRAGAAAALEQPGGAALGLGRQVREGDVEVVLHQRRQRGDVVEREHLVVVGVARRQLGHGLEQTRAIAGRRAGAARPPPAAARRIRSCRHHLRGVTGSSRRRTGQPACVAIAVGGEPGAGDVPLHGALRIVEVRRDHPVGFELGEPEPLAVEEEVDAEERDRQLRRRSTPSPRPARPAIGGKSMMPPRLALETGEPGCGVRRSAMLVRARPSIT